MTRLAKATCKLCGVNYAWLMSGQWFRGTKDRRERSSTLCPDCYEKVMAEIVSWCQARSQKDWCGFVHHLANKKRMPIQAILVVLETIDKFCNNCWDTEGPCYCTRDD